MPFLTVSGVLFDELSLQLDPGFQIDEPSAPSQPTGEGSPDALIVESLGERSEIVDRAVVTTASLCLYRGQLPAPRLAAGVIPMAKGLSSLRFVFHGRVVHELAVPQQSPTVGLTWRPQGEQTGSQIIRWVADHPGGAQLFFLVLYSADGREWTPLSMPQAESAAAIDFDTLPGGPECRLRIMASDRVNTAVVESEPFVVRRKGLQPVIVDPDDGATVVVGTPVTFSGQVVSWEQPGRTSSEMRWLSSLDGPLGTGPTREATLSAGRHIISLVTADEDGDHETFISVTVEPSRFS